MKGVALAVMLIAGIVAICSLGAATPPIVPPVQYEQFCEAQKVSGSGVIDVSTSVVDKKIALEYYNVMSGDGDIELDQENAYSQNSDKLKRNVTGVNGSDEVGLNLYENSKITYTGETPLVGGKYLNSKEFYGGIGAEVQEMYAVNELEKEQTAFFTSTTPYQQADGIKPEDLGKALSNAGRNTDLTDSLMTSSEGVYIPTHLIGLDTKTTFNGTWGTDATWHKIFYKDIKAHEMFTGKFEAEKLLKFHEYPVPEMDHQPCEGIDC
jgi:hypothetical protein